MVGWHDSILHTGWLSLQVRISRCPRCCLGQQSQRCQCHRCREELWFISPGGVGTVRLAVFSLYLPVGVRGHSSLLLYPSKITNVMMSKSFQSCGRTNSCCLKEAEQVRQEGVRESDPKIPSSRGAREKRLSHI